MRTGVIEILAAFDRIKFPPRGRDGGRAGKPAYLGLKPDKPLDGKGLQEIPPASACSSTRPAAGASAIRRAAIATRCRRTSMPS